MADRELITRADLQRALVLNAATKPVNVVVPAGVVVAAILLGAPWLLAIALVAYVALAAVTFLDEHEAARAGERAYRRERPAVEEDLGELAPPVATRVDAALESAEAIHAAIAEAGVPLPDVGAEVDELVAAMRPIALRAHRVHAYLATRRPVDLERRIAALRAEPGRDVARDRTIDALESQLAAIERLQEQLDRFYGQLDHVAASLETVHAEVVGMGAAGEGPEQAMLVDQVGALRDQVTAAAAGVDAAYAETRAGRSPPAG